MYTWLTSLNAVFRGSGASLSVLANTLQPWLIAVINIICISIIITFILIDKNYETCVNIYLCTYFYTMLVFDILCSVSN